MSPAKKYKCPSNTKAIIGWRDCFWQIINLSFGNVLFNLFYKRIQDKGKLTKTSQIFFGYINLDWESLEKKE